MDDTLGSALSRKRYLLGHGLSRPRARLALAACAALLAAFASAIVTVAAAQRAGRTAARGSSLSENLLTGSEEQGAGRFGASVALSADGSYAIAGGPWDSNRIGAAWMFTRSGEGWEQQGPKLAPEGEGGTPCEELEGESESCGFGRSVALSGGGDVALVGSPRSSGFEGAVFVYTRSGSTWTQSARLTAGGGIGAPHFGRSVAISGDGTLALVGGGLDRDGHGAVWVFTHTSGGWVQTAKLTAPPAGPEERNESFFGASVALTRDGTTALVGAPGRAKFTGAAWLFTRRGETWTVDPTPLLGGQEEIGAGRFGYSVALSSEGTIALVGARTDDERVGGAWAFTRTGSTWTPQKLVSGGEPEAFGYSVALSGSGEDALVGAPSAGSGGGAWLFKRAGSKYSLLPTPITAGATGRLGASVAMSQTGGAALLGAPGTNSHAGAALSLIGFPVPPPTITSIQPASGPIAGGTLVTIEGSGFTPGMTVMIGGEPATIEFFSETKLIVRTPPNAAGSDEVVVSGESGSSSGGPSFTYLPPPIVTSIRPSSGPASGGTSVTIEGGNFSPDQLAVTIGSKATAVKWVSQSKLTATTAPAAAGPDEVIVSDSGGTSSGGPTFAYERPPAQTISTATIASSPMQQVLGTTTTSSPVPPPVLGVSGNIAPVSGKVYLRLPGSKKFVLLTSLLSIPFGTIVDASHGRVTVTTQGKKGLQSIDFYEGEFQVTQSSNALVTAKLYGGNYRICPSARERAHKAAFASAHRSSRRHVVRKLWANGHGSYTTKGNYATGAVLGTIWETIDRCNGTGIHVITDSVLVTNLVTHKKVHVKAGHTYIAKAP